MLRNPVVIVPPSIGWAARFCSLGAVVRNALGSRAFAIHHIGSTSVPHLCSKDVIDIQLTVADVHDAPTISALADAGFILRDQPTHDHVPPGYTDTPDQWEKRYLREPPGMHAAHIHVRPAGKANQRYALLFRDYLRGHAGAAEAYARVKLLLAPKVEREDYIEIKDPVCDLIMQAAEMWAASTGWVLPSSDA